MVSVTIENAATVSNLTQLDTTKQLPKIFGSSPQDEQPTLYTAIRHNRFVELPYAELDESERRAMYVNLFNIYE
jgi:hypothetical protein